MTIVVGKYTFGAWMRRGIGREIEEKDTLGAGDGAAIERPVVGLDVHVNTKAVHKDFALIGPGDVIGINPQTVVRTEPRDWLVDYEPNYLPFVEFYDEDFVWRYSPAKPDGDRLRPWIALVVLAEDAPGKPGEFTLDERRLPLPVLSVKSTASLPPLAESWAWAHVHINDAFDNPTDFERFLESLEQPDHPNADRIVCRLACPRHLAPNTPYAAFVVPAFETGRIAGLGDDPAGTPAQKPAWSGAAGVNLPVYYRWRFTTGENEDFESLVKKLEPRRVDPRVGIRDMDGEKPGWGLTVGADIGHIPAAQPGEPDPKQSVTGLEGALKSPDMVSRPENVDPSRPFFAQLAAAVNFPEQLRSNPATATLPVVSPPIYGEHHALRHTVDPAQDDWLDGTNRDPRLRVPAGFGTRVVQTGQEDYVARAWEQVQKVLDANRLIRLIGWAMRASDAVYRNFAAKLAPEHKLIFFAPVLSKVRGSPTTLAHQLGESTLPPAAVSGAMRRLVRPRGPIGRRIAAGDPGFSHAGLVRGMAEGTLEAAPPKPVPADLATDTSLAGGVSPVPAPPWLVGILTRLPRALLPWIVLLLLVLLLIIAVLTGAWLVCIVIAVLVLAAAAAIWFGQRPGAAGAAEDPAAAAAAVEATPPQPGFHFVEADPVVPPSGGAGGTDVSATPDATSSSPKAWHFTQFSSHTPGAGGADSVEGKDFRLAAIALNKRLAVTAPVHELHPFDLGNAGAKLGVALDPLHVFPILLSTLVVFPFDPDWLREPDHLVPAMAYPDFDDPMYAPLRDLSSELLLPNIQLIPPNTITLLLTNPPFIESYLVGLNTEMGKELLWREYPTDRRGSYFRQFWDVKGLIEPPEQGSAAELAEEFKEVVPLDTWPTQSKVGTHRNSKRIPGEQLALTIRGELLKKYPKTLVYAQRAHRGVDQGAVVPVLGDVQTEAQMHAEMKFPIFHAEVEPDIRFYGFELTKEQARGADNPQAEGDDWGYFFVIQQLPGEPRFGMDIDFEPDKPGGPFTWNDLSWDRFPEGMKFVDTGVQPGNGFLPAGPGENIGQWGRDAAQMASILFQQPVMIAVHAKEMLEGL
jgi:hypothetical protein